jgi:hypothetical protein
MQMRWMRVTTGESPADILKPGAGPKTPGAIPGLCLKIANLSLFRSD